MVAITLPPAPAHARPAACGALSASHPSTPASALLAGVIPERAGRRELAELVPDHRLGHVHRHVLATVVHGERVTDHVGGDRAATRPRLDDLAVAGRVHRIHLFAKVVVDERTFLETARHEQLPPCAARTPAADDELVARLALLAGAAFLLAPRRHWVPTAGALALAAAERVVDGVHRDTTRVRPLPLPAVTTGLPDRDQAGFAVAYGPDRRPAIDRHPPHLGRRKAQGREHALFGDQLDRGACPTRQLGTRARLQLDVVHGRADRDVSQRQRVPDADLRPLPALHPITDHEPFGSDDVALLAVEVVQQRDARVAVRVVFDRGDLGRHAVLVATEIDDAVTLLVPAAAVPRRHAAVCVTAAGLRLRLREPLFGRVLGDLREVRRRLEPAPGTCRLALADGHLVSSRRCRCVPRRRRA